MFRWAKELWRRWHERCAYREVAKVNRILQWHMGRMQPWDRQRMRLLIQQHNQRIADAKTGADVLAATLWFIAASDALLKEVFGGNHGQR